MRPDLWSILEPVPVDPAHKSWKDVLRCLIYHCNDDGEAWPSAETIRLECGYKSRKAIVDALAGLRGLGLIFPKAHGQRSVTYQLIDLSNGVDKLAKLSTSGVKLLPSGVKLLPVRCEATSREV